MTERGKAVATGRTVFIGLAALTIAEYVVAVSLTALPVLFILAVAKVWLIVVYFMHIGQLREGSH
ncbi:MAG TPA: cytochrome C oxidase subunit IV family protein [Acidimicrobiia bacterium]